MPQTKRLLITGCGRSGTKFAAVLLSRHGLDVRHEQMGAAGIASWCMAVDCDAAPWGPGSRDYRFEQTFHQVRHPALVIASTASFTERSWNFIAEHIPASPADPPLVRGAKYWLHWNARAQAAAEWTYRIEDLAFDGPSPSPVYAQWCARLDLTPDRRTFRSAGKNVNTRLRGRAFHAYEEMCRRLGLPMPDPGRKARSNKGLSRAALMEQLRATEPGLFADVEAKAGEYGYGDLFREPVRST